MESTPVSAETVTGIRNWKTNFFPIWAGAFLSNFGSNLASFALIWHLTESTGSALVLTTASMVGVVPRIVLSPFIGALIDRWNRKWVMIIADAFIAVGTLALAILFWFDLIEIWHIYVVIMFSSIGGAFHYPTMTASISMMVPAKNLVKIQGMDQIGDGILMLFAAPLGALLLRVLPISQIMLIDVSTALLAILPLLPAVVPQPARRPADEQSGTLTQPVRQVFTDTWEGLRYLLNWRSLFTLTMMMVMINFVASPAFSLQPLLVRQHFGAGALELSYGQVALGVGMLLGGMLLSTWGGFKQRIKSTMLGIFLLGFAMLIIGLLPPNGIIGLYIAMFVVGSAIPFANGPSRALRQEIIEPEMQGRIFALSASLSGIMAPIGLAIAGPTAEWLGIQTWFLVGAVICLAMSLFGITSPMILSIEKGPPDR